MDESAWGKARWISLKDDNRSSEYRFRDLQTQRMDAPKEVVSFPAGYFRKEVELRAGVKEARAYVCGLGYYELYLNGMKVGDHVLDPAPTSYNRPTFG